MAFQLAPGQLGGSSHRVPAYLMRRRLLAFIAPSLRARLWLLIWAVVVPGTILAVWLILSTYRHERHTVERHLVESSRAYSSLVDAEVRERVATLRSLALSRTLAMEDFPSFGRLAARVIGSPGEWLFLLDGDGRELVNTASPGGAESARLEIDSGFAAALASGQPYISNLTVVNPGGQHGVFVAIEVQLGGGRPGILCLAMTSAALSHRLLENRLVHRGVITVIDREQVVVARSRMQERFVGRKATADLQAAVRQHGEGVMDSVTLDGHRSVLAFNLSPETGWGLVVAGHKAELLEPAVEMLLIALVATACVFVVVLGIAAWIGRGTQAVARWLAADAQTLARGQPVTARRTGIREADVVSGALADTARELAARQAALQQARDEALGASRAKDEFLAALSHELRTPLNPVLLLASDAAADPAYPPAVRELFATIEKNVLQEVRLIDDLLDVTRIIAGKLSLRQDVVAIDLVVREAVEIVRPWAQGKQLDVQVRLAADGVCVRGDSARLQQVLTNVLGNAIKFTAERGVVRIGTQVDPADGRVGIEIADSGIGMTAEEMARVFDRFVQGDHAHDGGHARYGGLGLGLSICRSLVEAHGGRIEASSPGLGRGATFRIGLPVMKAGGQSAARVAQPETKRVTQR